MLKYRILLLLVVLISAIVFLYPANEENDAMPVVSSVSGGTQTTSVEVQYAQQEPLNPSVESGEQTVWQSPSDAMAVMSRLAKTGDPRLPSLAQPTPRQTSFQPLTQTPRAYLLQQERQQKDHIPVIVERSQAQAQLLRANINHALAEKTQEDVFQAEMAVKQLEQLQQRLQPHGQGY